MRDGDAAGDAVNAGHGRVGNGVELNPDGAARNFVVGRDQLVVHLRYGVGGHGKANALIAARAGVDGGVDADYLAIHVDQRAARVARVNGGVGLDERLELAPGNDVAALGGDDACGYGFLKAEGAADGENPVAHFHGVRIAQLGGRQRLLSVNLDDRQIGFLVHADYGGVIHHGLGVVHQLHADAISLLHHMVVGNDVTLGVDDDSGTEGALTHVSHTAIGAALATLAGLPAKEAVKEILEGIVFVATTTLAVVRRLRHSAARMRVLDGGLGVDVHHRRLHLASNLGELVGHLYGRGNLQRRGVSGRVLFLALHARGDDRAN